MKTRRDFLAGLLGSAAVPALQGAARVGTPANQVTPAALAADPRRPQYHLLPAANWMNDPNAPIYWNGSYHIFYQYNPNGAYWGDMHWGHAVSADMVHWRHLPVALEPTPGGPDADGCFTGTAAIQDGRVAILYTGVRAAALDDATIKDAVPPLRETQCLAVAADRDLNSWQKAPVPVIPAPPPHLQVNGFRDPSPWRQGDWWYLVAACGLANQGGAVLLYRSRDLRNWQYMHILAQRDRSGPAAFDSFDPWEVWECPEFFPLGDWHVLIYSTAGKTYWQSGKFDEQTMIFHPEQAGIADYGSFYAAKTQLDKTGNRILWGWIQETRPLNEYKGAGWAGVMSLPRVLTVAADGRLRFRVAAEVEQLRGSESSIDVSASEETKQQQIDALRMKGCCGELLLVYERTNHSAELTIAGSEEKAPWLRLKYDPAYPQQLFVDGRPLPLPLDGDEAIELHLYCDGSVIEVFANGRTACTRRFYYSGNNPQSAQIKWTGSTAGIRRLSVWQLSPISSNRLTT